MRAPELGLQFPVGVHLVHLAAQDLAHVLVRACRERLQNLLGLFSCVSSSMYMLELVLRRYRHSIPSMDNAPCVSGSCIQRLPTTFSA